MFLELVGDFWSHYKKRVNKNGEGQNDVWGKQTILRKLLIGWIEMLTETCIKLQKSLPEKWAEPDTVLNFPLSKYAYEHLTCREKNLLSLENVGVTFKLKDFDKIWAKCNILN